MAENKKKEAPKPIRNDSLLESIEALKKEESQENTVRLLNEVVRARLLAPVSLDRDPVLDETEKEIVLEKDTTISFELIKAANGDLYYPVFTHGEALRKCSGETDQQSMIVNFEDLANMILGQGKAVRGFVINPMSENLCFTSEMIEGMIREMEKEVGGKQG
ncbi:SseB family protein [Zhenpiania hominis]|uniref:SseB family protein n=1 Tax=Zhenpiania hominis TaxID=2763644 RepID=A0A923NJT2_9FIRM|nr:SseB family protein [Zhenpiania hominis]MBC6680401.1 SseB family protein [Zhenpiania hominis]